MVRIVQKLRLFLFVVAILVGMPAHAATLPAGYTELEYLESTGTQYIDTGISLQSNNVVYDFTIIDNQRESNKSLFGSQTPYSGILNSFGGNVTTKRLFAGSTSGTNIGYTVSENKKHHILTLNNGSAELKTDGVVIGTATYSGTVVNNKDIYLFANNGASSSQYSSYKLFHFAIYDNNILVRNFIPAQQGTTVGLYDTVSGQFFTNAGTGDFVAGPAVPIKIATTKYNEQQFAPVKTDLSAAVNAVEYVVSNTMTQAQAIDQIANEKQTRPDEGCPAKYCLLVEDEDGTPHWYPIAGANGVAHNLPTGYTELQYIESTGTQYINTGIVTQNGIGFDVTFLTNNSTVPGSSYYGAILGGRLSTGNNDFQITTYTPVGSTMGTIRNGSSSPVISAKISTNTKLHISLINDVITYDDGTTSPVSSYEYTTGKNIYLFGLNNNDSFVQSGAGCRIYNAKLLVGSNVVFDGIPAKQGTTVGIYDVVSGQFFTNAGTGTFTAGPDM